MLVKTNKKDRKGKDIYINAITGDECILHNHVFRPSMRKAMRHANDKPKVNNRKKHGEVFTQKITIKQEIKKNVFVLTNRIKTVFHYGYSALQRKAAQQKVMHGIA
jgi:hypothetical protein